MKLVWGVGSNILETFFLYKYLDKGVLNIDSFSTFRFLFIKHPIFLPMRNYTFLPLCNFTVEIIEE